MLRSLCVGSATCVRVLDRVACCLIAEQPHRIRLALSHSTATISYCYKIALLMAVGNPRLATANWQLTVASNGLKWSAPTRGEWQIRGSMIYIYIYMYVCI